MSHSATTTTGATMVGPTRTDVYNALGRYVNESSNAYGQTTSKVTQRDAWGNVLQAQNIVWVVTVSAADYRGRPRVRRIKHILPDTSK